MTTTAARRASPIRARVDAFAAKHRSATIIIVMVALSTVVAILPLIPPLNIIQGQNSWYDAFANAGVFMLLAMGLNVVVDRVNHAVDLMRTVPLSRVSQQRDRQR